MFTDSDMEIIKKDFANLLISACEVKLMIVLGEGT